MYKNRGWKPFGGALQGVGVGSFSIFVLTLKGSLVAGDYLTLLILFFMSIVFFGVGIWIINWAKKNGKN